MRLAPTTQAIVANFLLHTGYKALNWNGEELYCETDDEQYLLVQNDGLVKYFNEVYFCLPYRQEQKVH